MQKRVMTVVFALSLGLSGCSNIFKAYTIDINQGNVVTTEMVSKLKPGMSPSQVRFVLGSPIVTDTLNVNRWEYAYTYKPGTYAKKAGLKAVTDQRLSVIFENGVLARVEGAESLPETATSLPASKDKAVASDPL